MIWGPPKWPSRLPQEATWPPNGTLGLPRACRAPAALRALEVRIRSPRLPHQKSAPLSHDFIVCVQSHGNTCRALEDAFTHTSRAISKSRGYRWKHDYWFQRTPLMQNVVLQVKSITCKKRDLLITLTQLLSFLHWGRGCQPRNSTECGSHFFKHLSCVLRIHGPPVTKTNC